MSFDSAGFLKSAWDVAVDVLSKAITNAAYHSLVLVSGSILSTILAWNFALRDGYASRATFRVSTEHSEYPHPGPTWSSRLLGACTLLSQAMQTIWFVPDAPAGSDSGSNDDSWVLRQVLVGLAGLRGSIFGSDEVRSMHISSMLSEAVALITRV